MSVRRLLGGLSGLLLLVMLNACGSSTTPAGGPTYAVASPTTSGGTAGRVLPGGTGTVVSTVLPTTSALYSTPVVTSTVSITATTTISGTDTVTPTPSLTPTLGPPTATATPVPAQATLSAAEKLDQALVSFAQAAATGNSAQTLQAQRGLLAAASDAQATANADQSPYGQQLRSALSALQGAATGNYDQMKAAHQALTQIIGANQTPTVGLPQPAIHSQQSLSDVSHQLQQAIDAYSRALNGGNQNDLLTAQRDLLNAVATANAATQNNQSPQAQQIQQALNAIHDGMGGDASKFAVADAALGATPGQNGSITTVTPTVSPTGAPTLTPSPHPADLQPLQNDVDNKLQAVQSALGSASQATPNAASSNGSGVKQAQDSLRQSIQKASDALANDNSPSANNFRNALGTARAVAGGDFTKIQAARDQLKASAGQ